MSTYADSSILASLYILDVHTPDARRLMEPRPSVFLTEFNRVELAHAIYQQVFRGRILPETAESAWRAFVQDCASEIWRSVALPGMLWDRSVELARRYGPALGVRTLDSLHVACALELGAERFWTFDERQARLAAAVGLDMRQ